MSKTKELISDLKLCIAQLENAVKFAEEERYSIAAYFAWSAGEDAQNVSRELLTRWKEFNKQN